MAEQVFGQLLIHTSDMCMSLELVQTPHLVARGLTVGKWDSSSALLLHRQELIVNQEVWTAIREQNAELEGAPLPLTNELVAFEDRRMRISVDRPDPQLKLWIGQALTGDDRFSFALEESGSPGFLVVVAVVWGLLCVADVVRERLKPCERRAEDTCGAGRVRSVRTASSWTKLGCRSECFIECLDGQTHRMRHGASKTDKKRDEQLEEAASRRLKEAGIDVHALADLLGISPKKLLGEVVT